MTIPKQDLPKYELILPASNKKITYRPFTVKEEKILLLSIEDDKPEQMVKAIGQIFDLCTFGVCDINRMIQVDSEYLYLHIRNKSLGEGLEVNHKCSCGKVNYLSLNLENINVVKPEKIDSNIPLRENLVIQLSYPTLEKTIGMSDDTVIDSIAKCVELIMVDDVVYTKDDYSLEKIVDYLESNLTQLELDKLDSFFKTMPRIEFRQSYTCKCGKTNEILIEGLDDFLD